MDYPKRFIDWAFTERGKMVKSLRENSDISRHKLFLGFTRHTPAIITQGNNGPNGSIKGTGFLPKDDYLDELLESFLSHIDSKFDENYSKRGLGVLIENFWSKPDKIKMDHIATIDMALGQTWQNIQEKPVASLLFYQPPMISFELKCDVIIHREGKIHKLVNAQHDVYHKPDKSLWDRRIAYEFIVDKIYDKSANKNGFGKLIWER
ncbi:MAG: hypothetical protein ACLFSQ_11945 [Candidatus Zixiibacteriota bacterium]